MKVSSQLTDAMQAVLTKKLNTGLVLAQFVDCLANVTSVLTLLNRDHTQRCVCELVGGGKVGDSVQKNKN